MKVMAQESGSGTGSGVVVHGNVYGGGDVGEVDGSATVNIQTGE